MKNKKAKKQSKKKLDKKQQELNKIAQEHFRLLTPTSRIRGGYYVNYVYLCNYEELGYTLESVLNICIMALDGYDPNSEARDIREAHKQFADVLEFTKNLIPHEELEFLDKSRKLLIKDSK
ncbi:hypothetical protein GCM10007962_01350 [Yeosuana aromativorans]|uniref:Uncharacterized protein n=1 Tax=Yeosuana aromativorans TaxID=288019 RepID=A0A8J3FGR7_9FLAO|nr:hypothetical protein [Yeosuana aromativorans]GGK10988.1 hypothetical protein GCM10007962_01350 [Yeosuana aromativorans]